MAKKEPITIEKKESSKDILDVNFLKQSGIESIQNLSGNNWTDFNVHDPGITILEVICYALTELGFRSGYDINDLFAESVKSSPDDNTSFLPHEILSSGCITYNDFAKLFLDIDGVNNIELVKSKKLSEFKGVFDLYVELSDINSSENLKKEILNKVKVKASSNRILCFIVDKITFFETDAISLDLTIEVSKKVDQSDFIFQIVSSLERYFSPSPNYSTLVDLLHKENSIEDIFSGPILENGFLENSEINTHGVRKDIYISDMVNFLMDIDEVSHIKKIQLYDDAGKNYNWLYGVKEGCIPRLDYDKTKLTVTYKGNTSHTLLLNELFSSNVPLHSVKGKSHKKNTIELVKGTVKDLKNYNSILNDFPIIYGIGQYGLPNGGSEKEKAQANQLRTFLFFFDQVLANYFSKLDGLKNLFSLKDIKTTNPVQLLEQFPGVHYCYKPFVDEYLRKHINLNDDNHIKKEWRLYLEENRSTLEGVIQLSIEDEKAYLIRRNKVLDHLLSRFGYSLVHYEFFAQMPPMELITYKINLLKELVFLGQNKFKGNAVSNQHLFERSNFDHHLCLLIGIPTEINKTLTSAVKELLNPPKVEGEVASVSFSFKSKNLSACIGDLFLLGKNQENYDLVNNEVLLNDSKNNIFSKVNFNSEIAGDQIIEKISSKIHSLSRSSEGFYSIEHIGLRPDDAMLVYGFSVIQNKVSIFSSFLNYSRDKRDLLINSFKESSLVSDSFSVIEIELNQFKIQWKSGGDEILSTHFFESKSAANKMIKKYIHQFNSKEFTDDNILRQTKYNVFYNEIEDPFSNIISFIIPSWPHRFQNVGFKKYITELFHTETPAHVFANICWMNFEDSMEFEKAHEKYLKINTNTPKEKEFALDKLLSLLIRNE